MEPPDTNTGNEDLDLELENQALELDVKLKGGTLSSYGDLDPRIHNQFLKNIIAFEESRETEPVKIRSLFPEDFTLPPAASMTPKELSAKIDEICEILERNGFGLELWEGLPESAVYKYLVENVMTTSEHVTPGGMWIFDGCDGCCEDCFQNQYCDTGREILEEIAQEEDQGRTDATRGAE